MDIDDKYIQPNNPTDEERHKMLKIALEKENRIGDFNNIVRLLGPPWDISTILSPGECKGIRIGIIGGGLAGLSSAFELRKLGCDITIFEMQRSRVGGRVYTHYFDKAKRLYGELGAMRVPVSHESTWHYINIFGLKTRPFIETNENAFIYVRNKRARNDAQGKSVMKKIYPKFDLTPWERNTPWQKLIGYALESQLSKINPAIRKEILRIKTQYSMEIEYLGSLSIRKVLEKMRLSQEAIELISCVAPFLGYFYYNSYFENLQEQYSADYAYRYEIAGGTVNLPLSFYNSLASDNPIEYNGIQEKDLGKVVWANGKTVKGIYKGVSDNKVILEYRDEESMETLNQTFDYVICAIPFSSLRNVNVYPMFSTEKMQAIKEINYISGQKTIFMCSKRFWEKGDAGERIIGGGSYTDLPIGSIWYPSYSGSNLSDEPGVLLASYNLNQDSVRLGNLNNRTRFAEIKRQVEAVHGLPKGYLDSLVGDYRTILWNNEKGFYGAFSYYMPEQKNLFAYAAAKPEYANRVYFAGEHISQTHGWMQGALNSGMKAANDIARHYKNKLK